MRTIRIFEHISLDGVIQHSDDDGDFPYENWTAPDRTVAGREALVAAQGERFDLLLGRRTYDIWSDFWPKAPSSPMSDGLNAERHALSAVGFRFRRARLVTRLQSAGNRNFS